MTILPIVPGEAPLHLQLGKEHRTHCACAPHGSGHSVTATASLLTTTAFPTPGTTGLFALCFENPFQFIFLCVCVFVCLFALICFASKMEHNSCLVFHSSFIVYSPFAAIHFSSPYLKQHYVLLF